MDYGIKIVVAITFAVCVAFCCIHMCDRALYVNHINRTKVIPTGVIIIESGTERVNNEKIFKKFNFRIFTLITFFSNREKFYKAEA